jgi:cytochrome c oxidase subunit II
VGRRQVNDPHSRAAVRRRRRVIGAGLLAALVAVAASGCTPQEIFFIGMPDPASEQGEIVQGFWQGAWITAWAVGFLTWGLMLWSFVAYRRRKNNTELPVQTRYNLPIEILYTVAPLIVVFGIFAFALRDGPPLTKVTDDYDHSVGVVGFRWGWTFNYLDEDTYDIGTPQVNPTLWLPVDERVRFTLNSPDVIHSFWIPVMLFKMDVIPGQVNQFEMTPNRIGTYAGKCAELCGTDHARMLFTVNVVSRDDYEAHMAELKSNGQTGQLETPRVNSEGDVRNF